MRYVPVMQRAITQIAVRGAIAMFAAFMFAGCSKIQAQALPPTDALTGLTFLVYGDSLTQLTRGGTSNVLLAAGAQDVIYLKAYPAFFASEGITDDNGGDSARALRFFQTQDLSGINVVILNCGLHDMAPPPGSTDPDARRVPPRQFINNLRAIADICDANGIDIIWRELYATQDTVVAYRNEDRVREYRALAHVALDGRARFVDAYQYTENHKLYYKPDGVHMNSIDANAVGQIIGGAILGLGLN